TGFEPPSDSDIVIEVMRTWPKDGETIVELHEEIGFRLSEPTAIMELSLVPDITLVRTEFENSVLNGFPGVLIFEPEDAWERETTYTATLSWGDTQADLKTQSWTFTTR
ncbi:Ig-like domain-containing protein, partial [Dehalococcoides mccartyi]|nr:Ig-like domain-containing protein [Dehalococcoides mccartyi]